MAKKKKISWKNLPSTVRTSLIGMAGFLVVGIGLLLYGLFFCTVSTDSIRTVRAEIISIDRVDRNLPKDQEDSLREKGFSEDEIRYELKVGYEYRIEDKSYTYETRRSYRYVDKMSVGDAEDLRYAMVKGEPVINPDTDTRFVVFGVIFAIIGLLCGVAAYVLLPKHK